MATIELKHNLRNPVNMGSWITIWTAKLDTNGGLTEITPSPKFILPSTQISGEISSNNLPKITTEDLPNGIPASKIEGYDDSNGNTFTFLNQQGNWQPISVKNPISISNTGEISHTTSGVTANVYGPSVTNNGTATTTNGTTTGVSIKIPSIEVDTYGHITSIASATFSIPQNTASVAGYVSAPTTSNKSKVWGTNSSAAPAWRGIATSKSYLYEASATSSTVALGGTSSTSPIYVTGTTLCIQNKKVVVGDTKTAVTLDTNSQNAITIGS